MKGLEQIPDLMLAGVPVITIIIGLVEMFKSLGLPNRLCPLAAVGVGAGLGALVAALEVYPSIAVWVLPIVGCAVLGLAATGLYKVIGKATWNNGAK